LGELEASDYASNLNRILDIGLLGAIGIESEVDGPMELIIAREVEIRDWYFSTQSSPRTWPPPVTILAFKLLCNHFIKPYQWKSPCWLRMLSGCSVHNTVVEMRALEANPQL
jgi:hypothetical protein